MYNCGVALGTAVTGELVPAEKTGTGAIAIPDDEMYDTVGGRKAWQTSNFEKVSLPSAGGGMFVYKPSGRKVDHLEVKVVRCYWMRFYSIEEVETPICVCKNANSTNKNQVGNWLQEGKERREIACSACPKQLQKQPSVCKPTYVIEWNEEDFEGNTFKVQMCLPWSSQKTWGPYHEGLKAKGIDVRNVVTIIKSETATAKITGKGEVTYFHSIFSMADPKSKAADMFKGLNGEQLKKVNEHIKKLFGVDSFDKLNEDQAGVVIDKIRDITSPEVPSAKKCPF